MKKSGIDAVRQTFGRRLQMVLDARGLPTKGFTRSRFIAELVGVTSPTAYKYLSGVFVPNYDILKDLARRLNVTPDFLMGVTGTNTYLLYDPQGTNPVHMSLPERIKEFSTVGWVGLYSYWRVSADEADELVKAGDIIVYTTQNVTFEGGRHYVVRYNGLMYLAKIKVLAEEEPGSPRWQFAFEDESVIDVAQSDIGFGYASSQEPDSLHVIGTPVYRFPAGHALPG
ncbi:helix-turn-helix domain-containing protein [Paraburkholderia elongata]|uniref:Helix-turn-helix domain-containing protein n=1 Tax=Paraburkholderia elongata TaxID=2675747 RepID=A0A972SL10_9BURK|nr:helix-turn-helix transcriptional regulator [Paraburkholderia elongata]NPT58724.1 helix-turn-helix domain-containing protein [Paraburkholderia elongata]